MSADRDDEQRLDGRPHHRSTGGERVRGRAGRRRRDHPVAAPARQRPAVDLHDQLEHPLPGSLLDAALVEGPAGGDDLPLLDDVDGEGQPLLDAVVAVEHAVEHVVEVLRLGLRQEADATEVDARAAGRRRPGRARRPAGSSRPRRARAPARRPRPSRHPPSHSSTAVSPMSLTSSASARTWTPASCSRWMACRAASVMTARPVWATTSTDRVTSDSLSSASARSVAAPLHCGPAATAASRASSSSGGAPAVSHRKYSTLPLGPGRGLAVTPRTPRPSCAACCGDVPHRVGAQRRVADHSAARQPLLAHLELRLDHGQQVGGGGRAADQRRQHQPQRDEGQVADHEVDRLADLVRLERAHVRAVEDGDAVVGLQRPGELAVADVGGDDVRRPRAAAGRR